MNPKGFTIDPIDPGDICNELTCASTDWSAYSTGYEHMLKRECVNGEGCVETDTYRCAAGYYLPQLSLGALTSPEGCLRCPTWTGVYTNSARTTLAQGESEAGATMLSGCSVPAGTYYDETGVFTISEPCENDGWYARPSL